MGFKRQGLAEPQKRLKINLKMGGLYTAEDKRHGLQKTKNKKLNINILTAKDKQRGLF